MVVELADKRITSVTALDDRDVEYDDLSFEDEGHGVERTENRIE